MHDTKESISAAKGVCPCFDQTDRLVSTLVLNFAVDVCARMLEQNEFRDMFLVDVHIFVRTKRAAKKGKLTKSDGWDIRSRSSNASSLHIPL